MYSSLAGDGGKKCTFVSMVKVLGVRELYGEIDTKLECCLPFSLLTCAET